VGSITISNLDDDLKRRLRVRAGRHGRRIEDEAEEILRQALSEPAKKANSRDLGQSIHARFAAVGGLEMQQSRSIDMGPAQLFK
jgi:plasmid stability protein